MYLSSSWPFQVHRHNLSFPGLAVGLLIDTLLGPVITKYYHYGIFIELSIRWLLQVLLCLSVSVFVSYYILWYTVHGARETNFIPRFPPTHLLQSFDSLPPLVYNCWLSPSWKGCIQLLVSRLYLELVSSLPLWETIYMKKCRPAHSIRNQK